MRTNTAITPTLDTGKPNNPLNLPAYPYELAYAIQDRMFEQNGKLVSQLSFTTSNSVVLATLTTLSCLILATVLSCVSGRSFLQ